MEVLPVDAQIMQIAASTWADVTLAVLPIYLVFTLGNRIISMIVSAFEGRGVHI